MIEIDLVGTFNMSRAAFEELKKTKGCILNITAMLQYPATPWQAHPSAAKVFFPSFSIMKSIHVFLNSQELIV